MLNRITIMGRLVRDPELRSTNTGTPVASFTIACDRDFKNGDGGKDTDFIDIVAWRKTAEFVTQYFSKGRMAVVEGRLQIREWKDKDGGNRRTAEIVAENIYFGDSKRESDGVNAASNYNPSFVAPPGYGEPAFGANDFKEVKDDDGDLPF